MTGFDQFEAYLDGNGWTRTFDNERDFAVTFQDGRLTYWYLMFRQDPSGMGTTTVFHSLHAETGRLDVTHHTPDEIQSLFP